MEEYEQKTDDIKRPTECLVDKEARTFPQDETKRSGPTFVGFGSEPMRKGHRGDEYGNGKTVPSAWNRIEKIFQHGQNKSSKDQCHRDHQRHTSCAQSIRMIIHFSNSDLSIQTPSTKNVSSRPIRIQTIFIQSKARWVFRRRRRSLFPKI